MRQTVLICIALAMVSCQPADVSVFNVKQRLDAGELVTFTEPGYRRPDCNENIPDAKILEIAHDERERIVLGEQAAVLRPGYRGSLPGRKGCFRIGGTVKMLPSGRAKLKKIHLVKLDFLRPQHLRGRYYASGEAFANTKAKVESELRAYHLGIVSVLEFEYLPGSASDEQTLKVKKSDGYEETRADGMSLEGPCANFWTSIVVASEHQARVLSGELRHWYNMGTDNCLRQGQIAEVKENHFPETPTNGQVRILKIKRFRLSHLSKRYFDALMSDEKYEYLKASIWADASTNPEFITVMDIEPVAEVNDFSQGDLN